MIGPISLALPTRHPGESRDPLPVVSGLDPGARRDDGARVARDFEALFIAQMLRAAHAAKLADDPMAGNDTSFRDMQDQLMARTIAAQSPLGVAKLLAARK